MKKFTTVWTFTIGIACLFTILLFVPRAHVSGKTMAAVPAEPPPFSREREPLAEVQTGLIANRQEMTIGTIKDWVFDLNVGRVTYVVGALDHVAGFNNRLFVIPWDAVKVHPETNTFLLIGDVSVLENAPSLALDAWPDLPTSQWSAAVDAYWQERLGVRLVAEHGPAALSTASDLLGMTIKNFAGQDRGPIKELAFNPHRGLIAYVVLSCEDVRASNRRVFFALPWSLMKVNLGQSTFTADVDKKMPAECREAPSEYASGDSPARTLDYGEVYHDQRQLASRARH